MRDNVINEKNAKIPLYMAAYGVISQWLKEGKYKTGGKLPGENTLAEQLAVNKSTLRQAVLLLREDGLIINHQGRDNIVFSNQDMNKSGLERVGNPIADFYSRPIDKVVTAIGFQPVTQKHQQVLRLRPSSVVAVVDVTYYCGDMPAGFVMVYTPHEVLDNGDVDLENSGTVYQYYTRLLSEGGLYSDVRIRLGQAGECLTNILSMQKGDPILILEGVLYSRYDTPVLSQELFFGSEQHELNIRRKNGKNIIEKSE